MDSTPTEKCKFVHNVIIEYNNLADSIPNNALLVIQETIREIVQLISKLNSVKAEDTGYEVIFDEKDRIFHTKVESIREYEDIDNLCEELLQSFKNYVEHASSEEPISNFSLIKVAVINETLKELTTLMRFIKMAKKDISIEEMLEIKKDIFMVTYEKFFKGFFPLIIALSTYSS